jgi:ATP-dependent DNA ligase
MSYQLKVKRDYGDLGDSLDVVPVGAWHGQGRKTGWWSPILLAVYNPDTGGFQALCKVRQTHGDAAHMAETCLTVHIGFHGSILQVCIADRPQA